MKVFRFIEFGYFVEFLIVIAYVIDDFITLFVNKQSHACFVEYSIKSRSAISGFSSLKNVNYNNLYFIFVKERQEAARFRGASKN